jgi:hypothetical protein
VSGITTRDDGDIGDAVAVLRTRPVDRLHYP